MKDLKVVFDNPHFVVVVKPSGVLAVASRLGNKDPRPVLKSLAEKQLKTKLWVVHRLDFEVRGLTLLAKTAEAHRQGSLWFEKHHICKTYLALTEGDLTASEAFAAQSEWKSYLVRGKKRTFEAPYGQPAITYAQCLGPCAWNHRQVLTWRLEPVTGRNHQLRYELQKRGFPILGDRLYGATHEYGTNAIALEAVELNFAQCPQFAAFDLPETLQINPCWDESNP